MLTRLINFVRRKMSTRMPCGSIQRIRRAYLPAFDTLEDRTVLATLRWTGMGGNPNWSTPENWIRAGDNVQVAPTTDDSLEFTLANNSDSVADALAPASVMGIQILPGYTSTLTLNRDLQVTGSFVQADGILTGSNLTVLGAFEWRGGTQDANAPVISTNIQGGVWVGGLDLKITGTRILNITGLVVWDGGAASTLTMGGESALNVMPGGSLVLGTNLPAIPFRVQRLPGTQTTPTFTNQSDVSLDSAGVLLFAPEIHVMSAGRWNLPQADGRIVFTTTTLANGTVIAVTVPGPGGAPRADFTGSATVSGGTTTVSAPLLLEGTIDGPGRLLIQNVATWRNGTLRGTGSLDVAATGKLTIGEPGSVFARIEGRTINNDGIVVWGSVDITFTSGVFNNRGLFDIQDDRGMTGVGVFENAGTVKKTAGGGQDTLISAAFVQDGDLIVMGSLRFGHSLTQGGAGMTHLIGGTLTVAGTFTMLAGSELQVTDGGEVSVIEMINSGLIRFMGDVSTLSITALDGVQGRGNYTQTSTGVIEMRINSNVDYDIIEIDGTVTLAGTLTVGVNYTPQGMENVVYTLLTFGSRPNPLTNQFTTVNRPASFHPGYTGTTMTLTWVPQ